MKPGRPKRAPPNKELGTDVVKRPLAHREAAREKSREADFWLRDMTVRDHNHSTEFRYWFNACITAARSAFGFLRAENRVAFDAWEKSLTKADYEILVAVRTTRDIELHDGGAEMSPHKDVDFVPTPGDYRHTIELVRQDGSHLVLPAVGALRRYLGLLRNKLGLVA